jgi:hypothetical protein
MVSSVTPVLTDDVESILGQFIYAFAQGAGHVRVCRKAIAALRARYQGPIQASSDLWEGRAPYVLPLLAQVGRLAALLATQGGRAAIAESDFTEARRLVEFRTHENGGGSQLIAGPICPLIKGEPAPIIQPALHLTDLDLWSIGLPALLDPDSQARPAESPSRLH